MIHEKKNTLNEYEGKKVKIILNDNEVKEGVFKITSSNVPSNANGRGLPLTFKLYNDNFNDESNTIYVNLIKEIGLI